MARTLISNVLDGAGALGLLLRLRARASAPWLTVLTYHRVANPLVAADIDHDVVDARPEEFGEQLSFLGRYCKVIGLDELLAFQRGVKLPPNAVLITFDDGYRDNHDTALPILKRHGMKAVFFIATAYVQERRMFWWDRLSYLVKRSKREVLELTYPSKVTVVLGEGTQVRAKALKQLVPVAKTHHALDLARYLDEIEVASGVAFTGEVEKNLAEKHVMSWADIRNLSDAGMSVQSHTRTHRALRAFAPRDLMNELGGSREELRGVLGRDVEALAYPVGRSLLSAPHVREAIRHAGYKLAFSNGTGLNNTWKFDPIEVRRLCLECDCPGSYFRAMVTLPFFAYQS